MKNKLILKYVKPYLFSLFFTAAMSALLWITVTYGSFAFMPIAAGLCALLYAGLTLFAFVNLFRGNKLFDGSSSDVFSVRTQKNIRLAGVALALPALIYCGIFAYLVKSYEFNQSSCDAVNKFQDFEVAVFGQSKIWDFIADAHSVAPVPEPAATEPAPVAQNDVDFGPFMADMQVKIKKAWYPAKSGRSKHAEVFFAVNSKGEVSKLRIERSSGSAECDKAALDAVENAAPYHAFPDGAPDSVDIKFTFDYNVFSDTPSVSDSEPVDYVGGDTFSSTSTN